MIRQLKTLLTVAGSDPTGGAGIQADIRAGISLGFHVMTAITAVTAQNSKGVFGIEVISDNMLKSQLASILEDVTPDAVKIGMVGSLSNLEVIHDFLSSLSPSVPVVVDPVLKSTAGNMELVKDETPEMIDKYQKEIFPMVTVVTPNLEELKNFPEMMTTANAIVLKGGHSGSDSIEDKLIQKDSDEIIKSHSRIDCENLHGTGCVFSSLLACFLGLGFSLRESFCKTSQKMIEIIKESNCYSLGGSEYGPLNINRYKL